MLWEGSGDRLRRARETRPQVAPKGVSPHRPLGPPQGIKTRKFVASHYGGDFGGFGLIGA